MSIPIDHALVCLNCDSITETPGPCDLCGSRALWPLSKWFKPIGVLRLRDSNSSYSYDGTEGS